MSAAPKAISELQIPGGEDVDPPLATAVGVTEPLAGFRFAHDARADLGLAR
jgi:hypothetical protein